MLTLHARKAIKRRKFYHDIVVNFNPNDVRHVIRWLGDRFTQTSLASALGTYQGEISKWCAGYATGQFPPANHHGDIMALYSAVKLSRPSVMRKLVAAPAPLSPRYVN
jgi:hypothetical protein